MSIPFFHIIHIILMSTPTKMMRVTTDTIIAGMERVPSASVFSGMEFKYDDISRASSSFDGNIRSTVFRIRFPFPFPTYINISIMHVHCFKHISWYVLGHPHSP